MYADVNYLQTLFNLPEDELALSHQLQYILVNEYLLNQKAGKAKHKRLERHSILLAAILTSLHFEESTRLSRTFTYIRSLIFTEGTPMSACTCQMYMRIYEALQ